jgi:hypothetical protein
MQLTMLNWFQLETLSFISMLHIAALEQLLVAQIPCLDT